MSLSLAELPTLNACLNGTSAVLLVTGYLFIRQRNMVVHRICMSTALITSTLFLASYLYYHAHHGSTRFLGTGAARPIYFTILISHTLLAALVPPLAIWTLSLALKERWQAHRRWARWTLPIWLYVSVTGVVVYWMLYQISWTS